MRKVHRIFAAAAGGFRNEVARVAAKASMVLGAILLGSGLALVTALPSLAQSYDPDVGSGNIAPSYGQVAPERLARGTRGAHGAFARVPSGAAELRAWNAVGGRGDAVGIDPDPNIQFQLNRESLQGRW